jgi:hypothetical protein
METNHSTPEERDSWTRPEAGKRMFTFGLEYDHGGFISLEEIDVWATCYTEARHRVVIIAAADYEPGWRKMIDMDPGGSAGLVVIF